MTASEKTTERVKKTQVSWWRSKRKTLNSCFLPSSLCSSQERVPCDVPDPSLWLTEGTAALFISPLTWLCAPPTPPLPASPSLRCQEEKMVGRGSGALHQGETLPVGSRQFQAIAPCSLGFCLHTHTRTHIFTQRQMTINGYDNVPCFPAVQSHSVFKKP